VSDSKKWTATEYIEEFAKKSLSTFSWKHNDIHFRSVFATLVVLKSSSSISPSYLSNADKILTSYTTLYKLIGMRFVRLASQENSITPILSHSIPIENPVTTSIFTEVLTSLFYDLDNNIPQDQADKARGTVNLIYEATLVYCWQFLSNAHRDNLVDKVIEELYLLKEIEIFKNRKGE
jgi:hypothetical protein